jgi:hypothetical protein
MSVVPVAEERLQCHTQRLTIPAGGSFSVPVPVSGGERVSFAFSTEGYDINVAVGREDADGHWHVVEPLRRVASHERTIVGEIEVPKGVRAAAPRALLLEFDNTYSWFTPKDLTLRVEVLLPPGRLESE